MGPAGFVLGGERFLRADDPALRYTGRVDFSDPAAPVLVYPYSSVEMRFSGTVLKVVLRNRNAYWDNYLGFVIDGVEGKVKIPEHEKIICLTLAEGLADRVHTLFFFKRQDSCHTVSFFGFVVGKDAEIAAPEEMPERRIEVFGDSVSAGEVSEAVDFIGKPDPPHNGEYSNSYWSYAAIAARKLDAQLHDVSQGGIALMHGTGWYLEPDAVGMEEIWDKMEYHAPFGPAKRWDFKRYTPHVALVAIGQNDSHPDDFMAADYGGAKARCWREHYGRFLRSVRGVYPDALIVAATTILQHSPEWDRAIGEVCGGIGDPKIVSFLYSRNGCGTPGHIRIPEAEEMAGELAGFIRSFGDSVWQTRGRNP